MVGESGCGKSTVGRQLVGLEKPTGGRILYRGTEFGGRTKQEKELRTKLQMVFQDPYSSLNPRKHIYEILAQPMLYHHISTKQTVGKDVDRLLDMVGLPKNVLGRYPHEFSGGQRQRVAMGRAIVREPSVFLFDEPLSNLDANLRNQMRIELRRLHQRLATTSIYVTHDQVEAMTLAEKILVLRAGNIEQYGTPDDIYLHPASVFVAQFMGSPSMNMIPATTDGEKLILPDGTPLSGVAASDIRLAAAPSKDVLVGLRCEDLLLDPEGSVQVTVDIIEALGPDTLAYCHPIAGKAGGGVSDQSAIIVRLPGTRRPAPGDAIRLSVRAGHGHVFDPASGLRCL